MQVEEYKTSEYENSDFKVEVEKSVLHPEETTIEFVDLRKEPRFELKSYSKKLVKDFIKAFGIKVLFKLAKYLDKSKIPNITFLPILDTFSQVFFSFSNIRYGLFIITMKLLFKLFRKALYYLKLQDVVEYKRLNFLFGLFTNIILIPISSRSPLFFYTCVFFLLKSLFFFLRKHVYGIKKRVYSESKEFYYIGVSLGFIVMSLISNESRNNLKIAKYFI